MEARTRQPPQLDVTTATPEELRNETWRLRRVITQAKEERAALAAASREVNDQLPLTIADLLELALDAGGFETVDELLDAVASTVGQRADACKRRNKARAQILQQLYNRLDAGSPESEES